LKYVLYLLVAGAVLFVLLWVYVRVQERWGIFHPWSYQPEWLEEIDARHKDWQPVEIETGDGLILQGIWRRGEPDLPAIILFQGNAGNITGRTWWLEQVPPEGWSALIFDYRGYGLSEGSPSEAGLYKDVEAVVEYVSAKTEGPLYYHGRSLGTVMASRAALHKQPAGIILDSGFPDAVSMSRTILPVPGIEKMLNVELNTLDHLRQAEEEWGEIRKFVIHGRADQIVPFYLGERLYEEISPPKESWFVEGTGHNNLVQVAGEENYAREIRKFLEP